MSGALAEFLGVAIETMAEGHACFSLAVRHEHMNPNGAVHGGVVYTLVDYAMGGALFSTLSPGQRCATLEIKINYLAAVTEGRIRAAARVVERTKRIGVLEARVHDDKDRVVALATGTFYVQGAAPEAGSGEA